MFEVHRLQLEQRKETKFTIESFSTVRRRVTWHELHRYSYPSFQNKMKTVDLSIRGTSNNRKRKIHNYVPFWLRIQVIFFSSLTHADVLEWKLWWSLMSWKTEGTYEKELTKQNKKLKPAMKIGLTLTWTKNQSLTNLSSWNYSCEVTGYQAHVSKKKQTLIRESHTTRDAFANFNSATLIQNSTTQTQT